MSHLSSTGSVSGPTGSTQFSHLIRCSTSLVPCGSGSLGIGFGPGMQQDQQPSAFPRQGMQHAQAPHEQYL